jgi:DNA-directed RNA polymerase subunit M/transcription elongation factor TFIIS
MEKFEDMKCKICGFEATTWKQLQVHVMDHTKERPYKCDICKKG